MMDAIYFQIWFSISEGLAFELYPLVSVQVNSALLAMVVLGIAVLRLRKVLLRRNNAD